MQRQTSFRITIIAAAMVFSLNSLVQGQALGDLGLPPDYFETMRKAPADMTARTMSAVVSLPSSLNYLALNRTTPAKNQGGCGSCWAFAAVGSYESKVLMKQWGWGINVDFSEQQQVSCNTSQLGCNGGWLNAIRYYESTKPMWESCTGYPSSDGVTRPCSDIPATCIQNDWVNTEPMSYYTVNTGSVDDMKRSLYFDGPAPFRYSVYNDFFTFFNPATPSGSVYTNAAGSDYVGGHAVLLIGWDDAKRAWLCKNSWGQYGGPNGDGTFWISWSGHANDLWFGMSNTIVKGGNLWASTVSGEEVYMLDKDDQWLRPYPQIFGKQVQGDPRGQMSWRILNGNISWLSPKGWVHVPGITGKRVTGSWNSQDGRRYAYATDQNDNLFVLNPSETGWYSKKAKAKAVDVGYDGTCYRINLNGKIFRWDDYRWTRMNRNIARGRDIAVDNANGVYLVSTRGILYKLNVNKTRWNKIYTKFRVRRIDVDQDFIYAISTVKGKVYKRPRGKNNWKLLRGINAQDIGCGAYR